MKTRRNAVSLIGGTLLLAVVTAATAQRPPRPGPRGGRPPMRAHTANSSGKLDLIPATSEPPAANRVSIKIEGDMRVIRANGIPDHRTGVFPNPGNPNRIDAQQYVYRIPANPIQAGRPTPLGMQSFGIAINGVPFDPGAMEFYKGTRGSKWQYEPLSGAIELGIDASHAHVQPTGAYHYHGLPTGLLASLQLEPGEHSPIIGWAADGFPIYAVYGFSSSNGSASTDSALEDSALEVSEMKSSYRLREGKRPSGNEPGGPYDGTFIADYEYVAGSGDLDQCNGRFAVTPEYPNGTYAYFLTKDWPVIPRFYRGTPSKDFARRGPPGGGPGFRPPGRRPPPPPGFGPRPL